MHELTAERLRELMTYDPQTGNFTWKNPSANRMRRGDLAGWVESNGYRRICIDSHSYLSHRLAWLYVHGVWPRVIDHINGSRADNRITNLRSVGYEENNQNRLTSGNGKAPGAYWDSKAKKWRATIRVNGKKMHLGYFDSEDESRKAYIAARGHMHPPRGQGACRSAR